MRPYTVSRALALRHGTLGVVLLAGLLLALGGCGEFNDDPTDGGLAVRFAFADGAQSTTAGDDGLAGVEGIEFTGQGEEVVTVVVGPIVITHEKVIGGGIQPYETADEVTDRQRDLLQDDAEESVQFLRIVQLPTSSDTVEFTIPPGNAGPWQLIAVGLRNRRTVLGDITSDDPIWYGFIGEFLEGKVLPNQTLDTPIILEPGCNLPNPPANAGCVF